jgi:hypothetical protein
MIARFGSDIDVIYTNAITYAPKELEKELPRIERGEQGEGSLAKGR